MPSAAMPAVGALGCVDDLLGGHPQRLPAEQSDRADAVTAQVQAGAAAEPAGAPDVARRGVHGQRGPDVR